MSWNNFNESYLGPTTYDIQSHWHVDPVPRGYIKNHESYTKLNGYFINWYKTGTQPSITKNSLCYFFRTHPKNLTATDSAVSGLQGPVGDTIYITTIFKDSATLKVTSGTYS